MSAILSADDLNDFISPGVACIKPVETLPLQEPAIAQNPYEVTTEDRIADANPPPAQITLTDCLACSGCVTSAEAVLVSLQSHAEVINVLNADRAAPIERLRAACLSASPVGKREAAASFLSSEKVFVASVSPQVRASLAATYGTSEREAGWMIEQLLCGPQGIVTGGHYGNRFAWVLDTNPMRAAALALEADDLLSTSANSAPLKLPRLTSACPGWICYAEKTHPHVLPHLSPLKSPQALTGTLVKSILASKLGLKPHQIWHLAVMPCFDKKLEAARGELTDTHWYNAPHEDDVTKGAPVRDVDCVITAREILMLADARGIRFPSLPRKPLSAADLVQFPDDTIRAFLGTPGLHKNAAPSAGTSGGFLAHVLASQQARHPGSTIETIRGRNADIIEYTVKTSTEVHFRGARYYGFRNIQNLVRKLRPPRASRLTGAKMGRALRPNGITQSKSEVGSRNDEYGYVEVMACPGGCSNGGGQIKVSDLSDLQAMRIGIESQKEWLGIVDETYYSMDEEHDVNESSPIDGRDDGVIDGISAALIHRLINYWTEVTSVPRDKLLYTTFNAVESDVGKIKGRETEHVIELASKIGGGW